jgi:hypothetical protein
VSNRKSESVPETCTTAMTTSRIDDQRSVNGMAPKDRRRSPRAKVDQIVYMNFQSGNGGIVLDVSSQGLGFQAADRVEGAESLSFRLSPSKIEHIEITGQVVWLDSTRKRGGLRLTHLPVEVRSQIQLWQQQHLLGGDVERTAESSSETVSAVRGPSIPLQERAAKAPEPAQVTPSTVEAPTSGQAEGRNASASTAWATSVAFPARTYPWETSHAALFDQEESRARRRRVMISLIVALSLAAAGFLYFGNRRGTGQFLIRLGESISGQQSKPSAQTQPAEGASSGTTTDSVAGNPESGGQPAPSAGDERHGVDDTNSSADTSGPNVDASAPPSGKDHSSTPVDSENVSAPTKNADITPVRGDNGEMELARARAYLHGSGREDSAVAAQLLWVAVGKGNSQAELELADLYLQGEGAVRKNCQQARILLTAAANNHIPEASERLARLRDYGCK